MSTARLEKILLCLIGVAMVFGYLSSFKFASVRVYVLDVLVGVSVLLGVLKNLDRIATIRTHVRLPHILFVYVFFSGIYGFIASGGEVTSILYALRFLIYILFFAYALSSISPSFWRRWFMALAVAFVMICMLQYIFLPDLRFLASFGYDPHMYRAVGTIFDPPIIGSVLITLFVTLQFLKGTELLSLLILAPIAFLFSRSTYLATFIAGSGALWFKRGMGAVFATMFLFINLIYIAPETVPKTITLESSKITRVSTVLSRKTEILQGLKVWATSPLIGIGYNRIAKYKLQHGVVSNTKSHALPAFHSSWVTLLATMGVLGIALLIGTIVLLCKMNPLWSFVFVGVFVIGIFDNVLLNPIVFVLLACSYKALLSQREYSKKDSVG